VATFPKHFHDGSEDRIVESRLSEEPEQALREFLTFVRAKLKGEGENGGEGERTPRMTTDDRY
jgi:hypothetical protein